MKHDDKELINLYISFIEKIANGKQQILNFEGDDMSFYRREIHILKIIGDHEGIYSQQIADKLGITRAVVHKILLKLENRELVEKIEDKNDKKKKRLSLTKKGKKAYVLHEEFHDNIDEPFFEFVNKLNEHDSDVIKNFLLKANGMIDKHF